MAAEESTRTPTPTSPPTGERRHAPLRARVAAALVDGVVLVVVCALLPQPFPPVLPLVLLVCYQALTTWWLRASVGKALLGLRVVRLEGKVTLAWALLRAGPGYLVLTALGLGWALAVVPPDRRPLHDRVLGADVIAVETRVGSLHQAGTRLADWARQRADVAERKRGRTAAALALVWAWLAGLGTAVQRFVDWLRGANATGPSALSSLSTSAAATISGVAAAGIAVVLAPVPPLADAADWLVQPRYWATSPSQVASTPPTEEPVAREADTPSREGSDYETLSSGSIEGVWKDLRPHYSDWEIIGLDGEGRYAGRLVNWCSPIVFVAAQSSQDADGPNTSYRAEVVGYDSVEGLVFTVPLPTPLNEDDSYCGDYVLPTRLDLVHHHASEQLTISDDLGSTRTLERTDS
jgi:uncharacterized RDD family membrane protein YckC